MAAETLNRPQRNWRRITITAVFYAVIAIALTLYATSLDFRSFLAAEIAAPYLIAAAALATLVKTLYPLVWRTLLRGMNVPVEQSAELYRIYAASWLGRYTPGKAAMIGARALYAERLGARKSQALVSFAVEQAAQIGVGAAGGLLLISFAGVADLPDSILIGATCATFACLIGLTPPILHRLIDLAYRVFGRAPLDAFPSGSAVLRAVALHILIQAGFGAYTMLVAGGVLGAGELSPALLIYIWASFVLALVGGMFVVIAPAGLGAREAIQLALLAPALAPEQAALLVLAHRVIEFATDCAFFGLGQTLPILMRPRES